MENFSIKQEIDNCKKKGRLYIMPQNIDDWDDYVEDLHSPIQFSIVETALSIMESMDNNPTRENIFQIARDVLLKYESSYFIVLRGLMFRYSKVGPEFCLALEHERAVLETERTGKHIQITLEPANVSLLIQKILENKESQNIASMFEESFQEESTESKKVL